MEQRGMAIITYQYEPSWVADRNPKQFFFLEARLLTAG